MGNVEQAGKIIDWIFYAFFGPFESAATATSFLRCLCSRSVVGLSETSIHPRTTPTDRTRFSALQEERSPSSRPESDSDSSSNQVAFTWYRLSLSSRLERRRKYFLKRISSSKLLEQFGAMMKLRLKSFKWEI